MIAGARVLKMYAWEPAFTRLVDTMRQYELGFIRMLNLIKSSNLIFFYVSTTLMGFLSFLTYELSGQHLTVIKVFATMAYLNAARLPFAFNFPQAIQVVAESLIGFRRLRDFYLIDEIDTDEKKIRISQTEKCSTHTSVTNFSTRSGLFCHNFIFNNLLFFKNSLMRF